MINCPYCQAPANGPIKNETEEFYHCAACQKYFSTNPENPLFVKPPSDRETLLVIRGRADLFKTAAIICAAISLVVALFGVSCAIRADSFFAGWVFSGSLMGTAAYLFLIAQLIYIRANLEK